MSAPRRRGLGRGQDALLGSSGELAAAPGAALQTVPVASLQPNPHPPRVVFDDEELAGLVQSIKNQGLLQPLIATRRQGGLVVVAGERRRRAARAAGLLEVPVVVREDLGDEALLLLALIENLQRSALNPIEEAEAYRVLRERHRLSQEEIAERVGKDRATVTNALRLLRLPPAVLELVSERALSAGHARALLAVSPGDQLALAQRVVAEQLSVRALEQLVQQAAAAAPRHRRSARTAKLDVHTRAAAEELTRTLATKVEIHRRGSGGRVVIHFHSEEELMRLFERFTQE